MAGKGRGQAPATRSGEGGLPVIRHDASACLCQGRRPCRCSATVLEGDAVLPRTVPRGVGGAAATVQATGRCCWRCRGAPAGPPPCRRCTSGGRCRGLRCGALAGPPLPCMTPRGIRVDVAVVEATGRRRGCCRGPWTMPQGGLCLSRRHGAAGGSLPWTIPQVDGGAAAVVKAVGVPVGPLPRANLRGSGGAAAVVEAAGHRCIRCRGRWRGLGA